MDLERIESKQKAKEILKDNYVLMFIVFIGTVLASLTANNEYYGITSLLLALAVLALVIFGSFVSTSCIVYGTKIGRKMDFSDLKQAIDWSLFGQFLWLNIITAVKVALWTLCFIIPGIIKAYEYALINYDFIENPGLETELYFMRAKTMTNGYKMDYFILGFSFFWWSLLAAITFNLGGIYVYPYIQLTQYQFYMNRVKNMDPTLGGLLHI